MLSEAMSTVQKNEILVSKPVETTMKPGAHLANPVRVLNRNCLVRNAY